MHRNFARQWVLGFAMFIGIIGCADKLPEPDPSVDAQQQSQVTMALMRIKATEGFTPMQIIISDNQKDQWIATVVSKSDPTKKADFQINKNTGEVLRLDK